MTTEQSRQPAGTQQAPAAQHPKDTASGPNILDAVIAQTREQSIANKAASFLGVPPEKVCALLRNVWKTSKGQPDLTNDEMFIGMSLVARYDLDPIAREVYVTRSSKGLMTIIGIDGYIKILDRTEGYDGFEQELGWSKNGEKVEWVETRIFSKTRSHPTTYRAFAKEYDRISGMVAKQLPWHMLRLFSLRHATRLFTPLGGAVMTEEEARWINEAKCDEPPAPVSDGLQPKPKAQPEQGEAEPPKEPDPHMKDECLPLSKANDRDTVVRPADTLPEPEAPSKPPADTPKQAKALNGYMTDLGDCNEILQVNTVMYSAEGNDSLTAEQRDRVARWCAECIAGIKSKRGSNS